MLQFGTEDRNVCMEEKTLRMTMKMQGSSWSWSEEFRPYLLMKDQSRLYFDQANIQEHQKVKNGGVVTTSARSAPATAFLKPCSIPAGQSSRI